MMDSVTLEKGKTVTGMDDYIKREALRDALYDADAITMNGVKILNQFPAADVAPVRNGRWIEPQRLYYGAKQYECSLCYSDIFWKKHSITEKYPHCPNCGCRMDGGNDE